MDTAEKAQRLRDLHLHGDPLVLVNVWDVASARAIADLGFPAVATSSDSVAVSMGFEDGEYIGRELMLQTAGRIAAHLDIPVTADLEAGYGAAVEDAVATARGAIEAGLAGMNFEDGSHDEQAPLLDLDLQVERIRAIRRVADESGVPLVVNARVDTYIRLRTDAASLEAETVRRARAYVEAGADCIYPILVNDPAAIRRLVREIPAPVNVYCRGDGPSVKELASMGVRRISFGPRPMRYALDALREFARSATGA